MTIPAFTAGQVLDADALNAALGDAAQETLGTDNTWTGTNDFEGGSVTVPDATAAQNPVTLNQMDDGSLSPTFDNLTVTGGLLKGFLAISTDTTLTADDVGKAIIVGGGPTITIPNLIPGAEFNIIVDSDFLDISNNSAYLYFPDSYLYHIGTGFINGTGAVPSQGATYEISGPLRAVTITQDNGGNWNIVDDNDVNSTGVYVQSLNLSNTTTAGSLTASASELIGGYLADGATQTASFTVTTDTAANILAAMPNAIVGMSFKWRFINNDQSSTGYSGTLAGGSGVTVGSVLPNPAVPKGGYMDYLFTFTAVGSSPALTVEAWVVALAG